ncbi:TPA: hypothetical protein HA238_00585 [Candidatus Micrarchaeota archaeon]|nr:hypothetical protein [Candidatus Micrarchaeota archaeon]
MASLATDGPIKPSQVLPAPVAVPQVDQSARTFATQKFINDSFLTAVKERKYDEFLYRLYNEADVNTTGDYNESALMWAVHPYWDKKFAEVLLSCGALINRQDQLGNTALHVAVKFSNVEMVKVLLEHGAVPDIKNNAGETPLDIIKPVLYKGADVGESRAYPTTYATIPREYIEQQDIHDTMKSYLREVRPLDKFSSDVSLQEMKEAIVSAISKVPKGTLTQLIDSEVDQNGNRTSPDVPNPPLYSWFETNLNNELGGRNFNFSLLPDDIKRFLRGEFSQPALARLSAMAKLDVPVQSIKSGSTGNSEINIVLAEIDDEGVKPTAQKPKNEILRRKSLTDVPTGISRDDLEAYTNGELIARSGDFAIKYNVDDLKKDITKVVNGVSFEIENVGVSPSTIVTTVVSQNRLAKEDILQEHMTVLSSFAANELMRRLNEVVLTTKNPERLKVQTMDRIKENINSGVSTFSSSQLSGATPDSIVRSVLTTSARDIIKKTGITGTDLKELKEYARVQLADRSAKLAEIAGRQQDLTPRIKTPMPTVSYTPEDLNNFKKFITRFMNNTMSQQLSKLDEDRFVDKNSPRDLTPQDRETLINFVHTERIRRLDELGAESLAKRAEEERTAETARAASPGLSPSELSVQRETERQEAERQRQLAAEAERRRVSAPSPAPAIPVVAPVAPIVSLSRNAVSIQDVAKSFTGSYTPGQLLELNRVFSEAPEARRYNSAYHIIYQKQSDNGDMLLFIKAHGSARIYKYEIPARAFDSDQFKKSLKDAGASSIEVLAIADTMSKSFVSGLVTGEVQSLIYTDRGVGNLGYLSLGKQRDEYRLPSGTKFSKLLAPIDFVRDFSAEDKRKYLAEPTENPNDYNVLSAKIAGTRALILKEHRSAMEEAISAYKNNPEPLAKLLLSYAMEGQATSAPHIQILSIYLMYLLQQEKLMDFTGLYTKINGKVIKPLKDADDLLKRARTKAGAQEVLAILQEWENRKVMSLGKEGAVAKLSEILNYANENFMAEKPPKGYSRSGKIYPYLKSRASKKVASEVNPVDGKLGPITLMAWMFVMTEAVKEIPPPPSVRIVEPRTILVNLYPKIDEDATTTHQNKVSFHADVFVKEPGKTVDAKLDNYRTEHGNPQSLKFVNYAWMVSVLVEGKRYLFNSHYGVDGDEQRYSAVFSPGKNVVYALDFKGGKHVIRKEGGDNVVALEFDRDGNPIVKDPESGAKSLFLTSEPNITVPRIGVSAGPQYEATIFIFDPNRRVPTE